jgi:hypothetical protein
VDPKYLLLVLFTQHLCRGDYKSAFKASAKTLPSFVWLKPGTISLNATAA